MAGGFDRETFFVAAGIYWWWLNGAGFSLFKPHHLNQGSLGRSMEGEKGQRKKRDLRLAEVVRRGCSSPAWRGEEKERGEKQGEKWGKHCMAVKPAASRGQRA